MFRHLIAGALFAGLIAGVVAAALQIAFVVPLILEGELYETGARVHFAAGAAQSAAGAPAVAEADVTRHIGTLATNLVAHAGFGLVLAAAMMLAKRSGRPLDARLGAAWGVAGFLAVHLAPAAGLPPELPGTVAAELGLRQAWWVATVAASALGLAALVFGRGAPALAGGAVLILLPHLVGAPHLDTYFGAAPPELSALFVARTLAVAAVAWTVLGALTGGYLARAQV